MKQVIRTSLPVVAWLLGGLAVLFSLGTWGRALQWELDALSPYQLFPLFGLLAFSLMWTHYVIWALRVYTDAPAVALYSRVSWLLVLVSLLAHPMIFHGALLSDGFGFPPGSYVAYVGQGFVWAVLLGTASWTAFMAYELKWWFQSRPWWRYILAANTVAMVGIFIHGLILGSDLQSGWPRAVWYGYGLSLMLAYGYLVSRKRLLATT